MQGQAPLAELEAGGKIPLGLRPVRSLRLPHRVCPSCGVYNGKLEVAKKVKKTEEGKDQK